MTQIWRTEGYCEQLEKSQISQISWRDRRFQCEGVIVAITNRMGKSLEVPISISKYRQQLKEEPPRTTPIHHN
jgi:hypothetical protein